MRTTNNLSQIAQIVTNLGYFMIACEELEGVLMNLRASQRGGPITLSAANSFGETLVLAQARIDAVIASKLESFFEMSEYNWLPKRPPADIEPSTYVFEMITFLTAYVDSVLIGLPDETKTRAYENALKRINQWLMETLTGREVPRYNESALTIVLADVQFIETEIQRLGRPGLDHVFDEVKLSINVILSDAVNAYMEASIRRLSYHAVKPQRLAMMLTKLAAGAAALGVVNKAERFRDEAAQVSRIR